MEQSEKGRKLKIEFIGLERVYFYASDGIYIITCFYLTNSIHFLVE
uniref:Uncharacterized protein n=1 Tax=Yersinia enterocolitica W22703 TaxID=913028 RepID=F4N277_YEREN|nr:unknown protein [Yersinia enterocolitica W22703]